MVVVGISAGEKINKSAGGVGEKKEGKKMEKINDVQRQKIKTHLFGF